MSDGRTGLWPALFESAVGYHALARIGQLGFDG